MNKRTQTSAERTAPTKRRVRGEAEKEFFEAWPGAFKGLLLGRRSFKNEFDNYSIETEVDQSACFGVRTLLIEYSSENYSKLLPGQYALVNAAVPIKERKNYLFLVVHGYVSKKYNPTRSETGLGVIYSSLLGGDGIPFLAMTNVDFLNRMRLHQEWDDFCTELAGMSMP